MVAAFLDINAVMATQTARTGMMKLDVVSHHKKCTMTIIQKSIVCARDQYQCLDGQCISRTDRCNGINNCRNEEDELHCRKYLTIIDW